MEYYQRLYDVEQEHWWFRGMRELAGRILDVHYLHAGHLCILDAGCGTGIMLSDLERYGCQRQVVGIDLSFYALQFCRKRQRPLLSQASVTRLPFKSGGFHLVTCGDVLQHLPHDGADLQALQEFYRVLKPGGRLYLRTNVRRAVDRGAVPVHTDYHRYTWAELAEKLSKTGFHVERATYANVLPSLIATLQSSLTPQRTIDRHQGLAVRLPRFKGLNTLMYAVLKGEARYLSKPLRWAPFGHSLVFLAEKPISLG